MILSPAPRCKPAGLRAVWHVLPILAVFAPVAFAATHSINSAGALSTLLGSGTVQPGDTIVWTNGPYSATEVAVWGN